MEETGVRIEENIIVCKNEDCSVEKKNSRASKKSAPLGEVFFLKMFMAAIFELGFGEDNEPLRNVGAKGSPPLFSLYHFLGLWSLC